MKNFSRFNRQTTSKQGFTLIELLVVIAIIAILATIILSNLGESRKKGSDAGVKSNMASIQTEAEVYFDQNGERYGTTSTTNCTKAGTLFSDDSSIASAITQIKANAATAPVCMVSSDKKSWALSVTLRGGGSWCVDSSGWAQAGTATTDANSAAVCTS
jgi:prepilin-type N-terminal cleavage/methylation domain-containing protein